MYVASRQQVSLDRCHARRLRSTVGVNWGRPMKAVINELRAVLAERQLSQTDLAELSGVSYTTIRRLGRRDGNPRLDDALRICGALSVQVEDLFRLTDAQKQSSRDVS